MTGRPLLPSWTRVYGTPVSRSSAVIASTELPPSSTTSTFRSMRGVTAAVAVAAGTATDTRAAAAIIAATLFIRFFLTISAFPPQASLDSALGGQPGPGGSVEIMQRNPASPCESGPSLSDLVRSTRQTWSRVHRWVNLMAS